MNNHDVAKTIRCEFQVKITTLTVRILSSMHRDRSKHIVNASETLSLYSRGHTTLHEYHYTLTIHILLKIDHYLSKYEIAIRMMIMAS